MTEMAPRTAGTKSVSSTSAAASNIPSFFSPRIVTPSRNPPSSSPSYFGFQSNDASFLSDTSRLHAQKNWSPPSSTIRSTVAASPSVIPNDQNPDFAAFKSQTEEKSFNLGSLSTGFRPQSARTRETHSKDVNQPSDQETHKSVEQDKSSSRPRQTSLSSTVFGERSSPKRVLSPGPDINDRRGSPASFAADGPDRSHDVPRFKLPLDNIKGVFGTASLYRAETLPTEQNAIGSEQQSFATAQHVVTLLQTYAEDILLLDLRVSTQYGDSHINGALNLCIPTTLLKRPSFNVQKLTEIFKDDEQKTKFEKWRNSKYIIVYDASSSQLRDAQTCLNTIKKFRTEGYQGSCYIVKGGFAEFSTRFPDLTSDNFEPSSSVPMVRTDSDGPEIAPVVGGCPMPATDKPANPFFGNIRQNMDLIGGVGQIALQHPAVSSPTNERDFPEWLQSAAEQSDQGRKVSQKYEQIERREKKRMEQALSGQVTWDNPTTKSAKRTDVKDKVQIAGIEKGSKNRYNNIWPFEHSRVKIQGVPKHECDYFNANFVQAAWSHKKYISTQAPVPATFTDFWNVVWQQDIRVIVMLTAEKEGPQVKAHNYWNEKHYGSLRLDFLSEKRASLELSRINKHHKPRPGSHKRSSTLTINGTLPLAIVEPDRPSQKTSQDRNATASSPTSEEPYAIVRRFTLTNEKKPFEPMREVIQLQYSSWPDFGAPAHPAHLLGLVEQTDAVARAVNNSTNSRSKRVPQAQRQHRNEPEPEGTRPILVHCSAGCGRTGTFCTVDSVIDMLKRQTLHQTSAHDSAMDIDPAPSPTSRSEIRDRLARSLVHESSSTATEPQAHSEHGGPEGTWVGHTDLDLIEKTVEDFRHQRISMVQSLRQFVLCYESVMEWLVGRRNELSQEMAT